MVFSRLKLIQKPYKDVKVVHCFQRPSSRNGEHSELLLATQSDRRLIDCLSFSGWSA